MKQRTALAVGLCAFVLQLAGCGSADSNGSGSGEVPGSRMSIAMAQRGCRIVCPTCASDVACPQFCVVKCPPSVIPCGPTTCSNGEVCCNASCGICTPPNGTCSQQACGPTVPCVDTVLCIRGFHWSPEQCMCVPDVCVDTVLCIRGSHWSPEQCMCVPDTSCSSDADCRLFSDYCTGCDCRALSTDAPDPSCSGPGVQCLADPCLNDVAQCVNGQCTVAPRPRLHQPHPPHAPHAPHAPHH